MTTSGSSNWTRTRNEIIAGALRKIGVVAQGATPSADQITEAAEALNAIVKDLQTEGVLLWSIEWVTKTFSAASEITGSDGLIYTCTRSHTSAAGNKPITGADWSTYWKQTGSTGGVWASGVAYVAIGDFEVAADTIGIEQAMMRDASGYDHPIDIITRNEYLLIGDKATTAELSTKLCFDDKLTPRVFLWPQPSSTTYVLHYLRVRALEDFDAATDNPDLMAKWIRALIYRLAEDLADEYGIILEERRRLEGKADKLIKKSKNSDRGAPAQTFVKSAF